MKKNLKNIFLFCLILGNIFYVCFSVFSYGEKITHPALTKQAAELYNKNNDIKISSEEIGWLEKGSIEEDADPRYLNHFYDPIYKTALKDGIVGNIAKTAIQWAHSSVSQTTPIIGKGDYSWESAIYYYQNGDKKNAFITLGHILHLIQDMAVPAHTRNDPHAAGDPYETWVENYLKTNKLDIISNLSINNCSSADQCFADLAYYTNTNFFSKDTINSEKYQLPEIINSKTEKLNDERKFEFHYNSQGGLMALSDYNEFNWHDVIKNNEKKYIIDDSIIHQSYFSNLAPKAVSYGAGIIKLFHEEIDKAQSEKPLTWWDSKKIAISNKYNSVKNAIIGSMSYTFVMEQTQKTPLTSSIATPLQITTQDKTTGRILAAFESASSADKSASPADESVKAANVPAVKQTSIASLPIAKQSVPANIPNNKISPKSALPVQQNPVIAIPVKQIDESVPDIAKKTAEPISQIPLTPFVKGGELEIPPALPTGQADPFAKGGEISSKPAIHRKGSDSLPPETNIVSAPDAVSSSTSAVFVFSSNEDNSSFECDLDNAGWQECGYETNMSNLSDGSHNLKIRAKDLLNNIDQTPVEHNWIVDTAAPVISITSYPQPISTSTTANFQIGSNENENSFICQFDMNPWQECSATTSIADLIDGWHIMEAKAIDIACNTGSSTAITWIVDTVAPTSSVSALLAEYQTTGFQVNWIGTDGLASTTGGLSDFDIQYKIDSEEWQNWIMATTTTQAVFDIPVDNGSSVYFRSRSSDFAGNQENWPDNENGDANTAIASLPPAPSVIVLSDVSSALSNWKSSFSWKHTVNGDDSVLVVSLHGDGDYLNDDAVTYDGQTLSLAVKKIHGAYDNKAVFMYYLANPPQGEHDITAKVWGLPFAASAATFLNCDISDPVGLADSFFKSQYDYVRTIPMPDYVTMSNYATTTINGMMLIDAVTYGRFDDISAASPGEGQTQYFEQKSTPLGGAWFGQTIYDYLYAGQSYKLVESAGLHSMDWITDDPQSAVHVIIGLNPKP